jgi:heparosan-N-sulfate-glucuronate 5-epimerase
MGNRLQYWRRIFHAYLFSRNSNLTFWHERPAVNPRARHDRLGPYYMTFEDKAAYPGPFDSEGVPQLDYHGSIGVQYNPIAVAQYGLAQLNRFAETGDRTALDKGLTQARWLARSLEPNPRGIPVWMHHFDFDYRETLRAPWYSGLAQGQGLSLLVRAWAETGDEVYKQATQDAFMALSLDTGQGGVLHRDPDGSLWIEEYMLDPPTHILNGFLWALWGVRDLALVGADARAEPLFERCIATLERHMHRYDTGLWSLYEQSGTVLPMIASHFYHRLHIVQLRIMFAMTGRAVFQRYADRWEAFAARRFHRTVSLAHKVAFKLLYY